MYNFYFSNFVFLLVLSKKKKKKNLNHHQIDLYNKNKKDRLSRMMNKIIIITQNSLRKFS